MQAVRGGLEPGLLRRMDGPPMYYKLTLVWLGFWGVIYCKIIVLHCKNEQVHPAPKPSTTGV